jgi:hypothetical protein
VGDCGDWSLCNSLDVRYVSPGHKSCEGAGAAHQGRLHIANLWRWLVEAEEEEMNNAGTWFAVIGGGLLVYFLWQAVQGASKTVQTMNEQINPATGLPQQ